MNSITNLMAPLLDTDIQRARLISSLSGRPALVQGDVYIWAGHLLDRATAVTMLIKMNNKLAVSDRVKVRLHKNYKLRFAEYEASEPLMRIRHSDEETAARIWFGRINVEIAESRGQRHFNDDEVRQILIELHQT